MTDATDSSVADQSRALARALLAQGLMLTTAESCTGGWIAKVCTDLAGSSQWFERGFVTYSNEAKQQELGISAALLARYGAVSEATVAAMTTGALAASRAQIAVAVSGIAGPDGGSAEKPVGTVFIAWQRLGRTPRVKGFLFPGDRDQVRRQTVAQALGGLLALCDDHQ